MRNFVIMTEGVAAPFGAFLSAPARAGACWASCWVSRISTLRKYGELERLWAKEAIVWLSIAFPLICVTLLFSRYSVSQRNSGVLELRSSRICTGAVLLCGEIKRFTT